MAANSTSQSNERQATAQPVAGRRVLLALGLWLAGSVILVGITLVVAMSLAPAWASNANESATVIVAEVYAMLIAALYAAFGGRTGISNSLRLHAVPARAYVTAFAVAVSVIVVADLAYIWAGFGDTVRAAYVRVGTDGGRLGEIGPITTLLGLVRACVLAPIVEELLLRGAIYGWSRRRLPAWPAIILNGIVLGSAEGAIGGVSVLIPRAIFNYLALNWIRERTGSTLPGIALHIAHNTIVVIAVYLLMHWR